MMNVTEACRKKARDNRRRGDALVADMMSESGDAKAEAPIAAAPKFFDNAAGRLFASFFGK